MTRLPAQEWLLIFYSVPSHPVSGRMKIWRKLAKAGAVPLKGAVYILPASDEHEELFQWIIGEVKSLRGDGAFVRTSSVETIPDPDVKTLFNVQRDAEYRDLDKTLDGLERKVQSARKSAVAGTREAVTGPLSGVRKTFEEIGRRDFFKASLAKETAKRIQALEVALKGLQEPDAKNPHPSPAKTLDNIGRRSGSRASGRSLTAWHPHG